MSCKWKSCFGSVLETVSLSLLTISMLHGRVDQNSSSSKKVSLYIFRGPSFGLNFGRFPFSQNFRNFWFGGKWNTFHRFVRLENSQKKWEIEKGGPVFPVGISERMSCSIYVSRSLYQFQVHGRAPRRTVVYELMEQLFTNRKFHFCSHRNFRFFSLNGKRPLNSDQDLLIDIIYSKFISLYCTRSPSVDLKEQSTITK